MMKNNEMMKKMGNGEKVIGMLHHVIIGLRYRSCKWTPSWASDDEEECTEVTERYQRKRRTKRSVPVTTLFLLLLLLWTLELYLILSYRYEDLLISWSYQSYLDGLILMILSRRSTILSWSLDLIIRWWSKIHFFISTLHYYLHAFDMPLTHVFHW